MNYKKLNSPEFWDLKISTGHLLINESPIYKDKLRYILKEIKECSGNLLDIGIGYADIEELIARKNINIKISGLDISKFAVQEAAKKYKGNFLVGSITKIPFKSESFDCVLALDILEHLSSSNCSRGLKEIKRVMKKDARLVISIPINEKILDSKNNHHIQKYNFNIINRQLSNSGYLIFKKYYLTAYKNFYFLKNIINKIIKISNPNLLILVCKKK
jgi:ubiquinone/menaquinone biosynthesis C-methylase UbiE